MLLNEEQLSIINDVRYIMGLEDSYFPKAPRYICEAIDNIISFRRDFGLLSAEKASILRDTLSTAILAGISHHDTFGSFMLRSCPPIKDARLRDLCEYGDLVMVARLAWLDWIIETGEIKPDLLAGDER